MRKRKLVQGVGLGFELKFRVECSFKLSFVLGFDFREVWIIFGLGVKLVIQQRGLRLKL